MTDPNYETAIERPADREAQPAGARERDVDVREGPLYETGDPKDHPVLPDDVSETADPEDPTKLRQPAPAEEASVEGHPPAVAPTDAPADALPDENG